MRIACFSQKPPPAVGAERISPRKVYQSERLSEDHEAFHRVNRGSLVLHRTLIACHQLAQESPASYARGLRYIAGMTILPDSHLRADEASLIRQLSSGINFFPVLAFNRVRAVENA
jgi:hypothetical protein